MRRHTCPNCLKPDPVCYCHLIKPINNLWPITIIQHYKESSHAIGTARIAQLSLQNCQTKILHEDEEFTATAHRNLGLGSAVLVYPEESATSLPLQKIQTSQPLILIDASWRKSRKIIHQSPYLRTLPSVSFSLSQTSRYRIRKEPKPGYCSTLEAIVYLLATLEDDPDKYQPLLKAMDWMIDQQISFRDSSTNLSNKTI